MGAASLCGSIALITLLMVLPARAETSSIPTNSPIRMRCATCHRVDADGRIPKIENIRTTPDEWANIVDRMVRVHMKMRQFPPPPEEERRFIVRQLADKLALGPKEMARVAYVYEGSTRNTEERPPDDKVFQKTCMGCHSYGKILSYRRTPDSWAKLRDFHVGMWPTILLIYGEYDWPSTAAGYLQQLARQLPRDSADWKQWQGLKNKPRLFGSWYVSGSQPGKGDYDGRISFSAQKGGGILVNRLIVFQDGSSQRWSGQLQLYAGHLAQGDINSDGATARLTVTVSTDPGSAGGRWFGRPERYVYGQERYYRNVAKTGRIVRVTPRTIYRLAPPAYLTVKMVNAPVQVTVKDISLGDKALQVRSVKRVDANTLQVAVKVGDRAVPGVKEVHIGAARAGGLLVVADRVDYIKVVPQSALSRLGGIKFAKEGVQFVAQAFANGPDRHAGTRDDIYLGNVQASWTLEPYHITSFDASRVDLVGQIDRAGLFLPADESINLASPTRNNNGRVWVVARYRPGPSSREMLARSYLMIGFPDFNRAIN